MRTVECFLLPLSLIRVQYVMPRSVVGRLGSCYVVVKSVVRLLLFTVDVLVPVLKIPVRNPAQIKLMSSPQSSQLNIHHQV